MALAASWKVLEDSRRTLIAKMKFGRLDKNGSSRTIRKECITPIVLEALLCKLGCTTTLNPGPRPKDPDWYRLPWQVVRSQKEHWLGWLVAKDCQARAKGHDPASIMASRRYQFITSSPAMFWIAECAGLSSNLLDAAEDAAIKAAEIHPKDGQPHGKMMREVLPWLVIEDAIFSDPEPASLDEAETVARQAFDRLCEKRGAFRKLKPWLAQLW